MGKERGRERLIRRAKKKSGLKNKACREVWKKHICQQLKHGVGVGLGAVGRLNRACPAASCWNLEPSFSKLSWKLMRRDPSVFDGFVLIS